MYLMEPIRFAHRFDTGLQTDFNTSTTAFCKQHRDDVFGGCIAEQLAQRFFVIRNAVLDDHVDEIVLRISIERGFGEMRVLR